MKLALVIIAISLMIDRIITRKKKIKKVEKEEAEYDDIDKSFYSNN